MKIRRFLLLSLTFFLLLRLDLTQIQERRVKRFVIAITNNK